MFKSLAILFAALALLLSGCALHNKVLVATGTVVGISVAQNPGTGMYEAKLGYARAELALVPVSTNGTCPAVITELDIDDMFKPSGGIYQRLAVGEAAVQHFRGHRTNDVVGTNVFSVLKAKVPALP